MIYTRSFAVRAHRVRSQLLLPGLLPVLLRHGEFRSAPDFEAKYRALEKNQAEMKYRSGLFGCVKSRSTLTGEVEDYIHLARALLLLLPLLSHRHPLSHRRRPLSRHRHTVLTIPSRIIIGVRILAGDIFDRAVTTYYGSLPR